MARPRRVGSCSLVEAVIRGFPGLGVVRDGQKWVALAMPVYALAAAGTVVTLRPRVPAPVSPLLLPDIITTITTFTTL